MRSTDTVSKKSKNTTGKVRLVVIALALVAIAVAGIAAGDAATTQESSEAAFSWFSSYGYGWSWR